MDQQGYLDISEAYYCIPELAKKQKSSRIPDFHFHTTNTRISQGRIDQDSSLLPMRRRNLE